MKKFVITVCLFFLPVLLLVVNYSLLSITRERSGDLSKMAKVFFEKGYHNRFDITPDSVMIQDIEISELPDSSVIICFGDSFSNRRPYCYLQPVAEYYRKTIVNALYNLDCNPFEAALGFITKAPQSKLPKIMIVECVERNSIPCLYWLDTANPPTMEYLKKGKKHSTSTQKKAFDKEIMSYYQFRLGITDNNTIKTKLNRPYFTARNDGDNLYSYYEDTIHYSKEYIAGAIQKMSQLHQLASEHNITLVYMIAPNKSTLYAPYSVDNNNFFTILENGSPFDTIPYVYNPMKTLRPLADKGNKDIYYADDTHWTPATAKIVGEELTNIILKQLTTNNSND